MRPLLYQSSRNNEIYKHRHTNREEPISDHYYISKCTGFILNLPMFQRASDDELFEDFHTWVVEEEEEKRNSFLADVKADYGAIPMGTNENGGGDP